MPLAVLESIRESGVVSMEIYNLNNRLFMIMEIDEGFSPEQRAVQDRANPDVQAWETMTWRFQQAIPGTPAGEKWQVMAKIFDMPPTAPR